MIELDCNTIASEKGGVGKTACTIGIAAELATRGLRVGLVDLDPRATTTTWTGVEPGPGEHVGAILGSDDVTGAAEELALACAWNPNIRVVPAARDIAALESAPQEYGDLRLKRSMAGWDVDAIIIDSPNRQGGFLIRSALAASTRVTYTTTPDEDGRTGVMWARHNVAKFKELSLLNPDLHEAGIIVTRWPDTIPTLDARGALEALDEDSPGMVLRPLIPERVIVREMRAAERWWGEYRKGTVITEAFADLVDVLYPHITLKAANA